MNKLWKLAFKCGHGTLYGLFLATDEEIAKLKDKEIYFGEENGKHSEVCGKIDDDELTLFSDDPYVIEHVKPFGYDPLEYLGEE